MKKLISPYKNATLFAGDVLRCLPASWVWPISWVMGMILYYTRKGRRREVEKAYEKFCKVAEIGRSPRELTKLFFQRQLMLMTANYLFQGVPQARWDHLCDFEGLDGVREAVRNGDGVLVVTMHFGTHLLSMARLEQEGFKLTTMRPAFMRDIASSRLKRMLFIHREAIYAGDAQGLGSPVRAAVKKLKEKYVVGVAPDGDQGVGETMVKVFGGDYPVRSGVLEIARLARCPMVFAAGAMRGHRYFVRYFPVWRFPEDGGGREFVDGFFADCLRNFEGWAREFPECIWWSRPMCIALGLKGAGRETAASNILE